VSRLLLLDSPCILITLLVYGVSDEKPRDRLTAADLRFMQDVAAAVMEHLELSKDSDDRIKGERMVRGLTQFIERSSVQDMRDEANRLTTMERQTENARLQTLEEDTPSGSQTPATANRHSQRKRDTESETARIFHRAARIIRQSTLADGVVFFDTSAAGIKTQLYDDSRNYASSDESPTNTTTDFDTADSTATARRRRRQQANIHNRSEAAEQEAVAAETNSKACPVAGLSLSKGNAVLAMSDFALSEAAMERYIDRYPFGKFFNYNEEGLGVNSSDEKSERSETDQSDRTMCSPNNVPKRPRKRRERFIPTEFLKVLPNVRTLIFLPLWDPSSEKWVAGGFIWTTQAGRLMSPENELPYLQAFGNSITSEVARLSAQKADRAKTTFIASISHELRSPLHGILGSVEFLRDTVASAYQDSLVSSIETCGKTLLDTIDHVLDHAKINKLRSTTSKRKQRAEGRAKRLPSDNSILGVTADFDLAQLVEEVCDTVCAGHMFRTAHGITGVAAAGPAGFDDPIGDNVKPQGHSSASAKLAPNSVVVSLIVAPFVSWAVRSQPGALRRIVMNLLGNALKYTASGFIAITLLQTNHTPQSIDLLLRVEDSGRGMSVEYQNSKLFSPFSQEDPFASGTGLGLSIVKQIVESLRGEIEVKSQLQVGTKIEVVLRLPLGQNETTKYTHDLLRAPEALRGTSVGIICECDSVGGERGMKIKESMQKSCQGFDMNIVDVTKSIPTNEKIDFLLTDCPSLDQLLQEPSATWVKEYPLAVVCICTDTAEKTSLEKRLGRQINALGWVAEVVTQP
jgi:signal transduction histidine kinase